MLTYIHDALFFQKKSIYNYINTPLKFINSDFMHSGHLFNATDESIVLKTFIPDNQTNPADDSPRYGQALLPSEFRSRPGDVPQWHELLEQRSKCVHTATSAASWTRGLNLFHPRIISLGRPALSPHSATDTPMPGDRP